MTPTNLPSFDFSDRARRTTAQPIGYLITTALANPKLISLAAGLVDYASLPGSEVNQLVNELLGSDATARAALQYGNTEGNPELRHLLLDHLARLDGLASGDDLDASPDDIVVTNGSQQMLLMLADILVNPGDIVITEWPSYFVYTNLLTAYGAEVRCVDIDADGAVPESLEAVLEQLAREGRIGRVKIVYLCDYHQNPTGITLAEARRPQILEIIQRYSMQHRILLIEDAAYRELTYTNPLAPGEKRGEGPGMFNAEHPGPSSPRSIKYFDTDNRCVALLQTFSKPFAPGLKIGYGLLPRDLVDAVLLQKGSHDFGSPNFSQHLLTAALKQGIYHRHGAKLRAAYAAKRDAMLEALDEHFSDLPGASWTRPSGGLYVWLTLPAGVDTGQRSPLFSRAIAEGVLYVPGDFCYPVDPTRTVPRNAIRLSFGVPTIEQIHEGIARLARALR
jgi:2-aminoadipate transaminase